MKRTITIFAVSSLLLAGAGCGGGTRPGNDAGGGGGDDAYTPGVDAYVDMPDAFVEMPDAFVDMPDMGSTGSGACTNTADQAILMSMDVTGPVGDCAQSNFGAEPGTMNCIVMMTGLSTGCAMCYDDSIHCVFMHCLTMCIGGDTPECTACREMNCDPAFAVCSGL